MTFTVLANMKMQLSACETSSLVHAVTSYLASNKLAAQTVIFPDHLCLQGVGKMIEGVSGVFLGMQDASEYSAGAYTGQVSAKKGASLGAQYAIVGHMESRKAFALDDASVVRKACACRDAGLHPVICFGAQNSLPEEQLDALMRLLHQTSGDWPHLTLAFEPSASIGSGKACDAERVMLLLKHLRKNHNLSNVKFAYGGSVTADNLSSFYNIGVESVLVGSASHTPERFLELLRVAQTYS